MPVHARIFTDPDPGTHIIVRVWAWITGHGDSHIPETEPVGSTGGPRQNVTVHAEWVDADFDYIKGSANGTPSEGAYSLDWKISLNEDGSKQELSFRLDSPRREGVTRLACENRWVDSTGAENVANESLDHRLA